MPEQKLEPEKTVVVIDPGHDSKRFLGASGKDEKGNVIREEDLNLAVGLALRRELQARGYRVVLTRETSDPPNCPNMIIIDKGDDLRCRTTIAKNAITPEVRAVIFVSIHHNSAPSAAKGTETFIHYRTDYRFYEESKRLARAIQSALMKALWNNDQSYDRTRGEGYKLDSAVYPPKSPDDQKAGFQVLRETGNFMPACLVEVLFLSNPGDLAVTQEQGYANKVARAIADGIDRYVTGVEPGPIYFGSELKAWIALGTILLALVLLWLLGR